MQYPSGVNTTRVFSVIYIFANGIATKKIKVEAVLNAFCDSFVPISEIYMII